MKSVSIIPGFYSQKIQHDDILIYNPEGSASPLVLTGKARFVFSTIRKLGEISENDLIKKASMKGIVTEDLRKIINEFSLEKIVSVEGVCEDRIAKATVVKNKKLTFWIHITDQCQLECDYCYICKGKRVMRMDVFRTLLDTIRNNLTITRIDFVQLKFAGGEPLLHFELLRQMVSEVKQALIPMGIKLTFSIITNAVSLNPSICGYLKKENFTVSVSLDGIHKYNRARKYRDGRDSFEDTVRGITTLLNFGTRPHILTVVSNDNIDGLTSLLRFASEHKLAVTLILCRAVNKDGTLVLNVESARQKLLKQFKRWNRIPIERFPQLSISTMKFKGKRTTTCGAGKNYFSIGPCGEVGSCQMTIDEPIISKLSPNDKLSDISKLDKHRGLPSECGACMWKYVCVGGCKVLAQRSGNNLTKTPLCPIIKAIAPQMLAIEGKRIQERAKNR